MAIKIDKVSLKSGINVESAVAVVTLSTLNTCGKEDRIIGLVDVYASVEARRQRLEPIVSNYFRFDFKTEDRETPAINQAYDHINQKAGESVSNEVTDDSGETVTKIHYVHEYEHALFGACEVI